MPVTVGADATVHVWFLGQFSTKKKSGRILKRFRGSNPFHLLVSNFRVDFKIYNDFK